MARKKGNKEQQQGRFTEKRSKKKGRNEGNPGIRHFCD